MVNIAYFLLGHSIFLTFSWQEGRIQQYLLMEGKGDVSMKHCAVHCLVLLLFNLAVYRHSVAESPPPSDLLEMKVTGVAMDPQGPTPIVILEALKGRQAFPIWIGMHEAQAIALEIEGTSTPRPLTHSLLKNMLTELRVNVVRVVIHDLRDNTFYASILLQHGATTHTLDARPSDAIVLALGVKAPIYVTPQVLQSVHTVTLSPPVPPPASIKKLGMHIQSLDEKLVDVFHLDSADGVLVSFVEEDSQAERNGIRGGDVITEVDGHHIKGMDDLINPFKDAKVGQEIVLQVLRDRRPLLIRWRLYARD